MGTNGPSYYAVFHCCSQCGSTVWVEDKVAPEGSNPSNISRKDSTCNSCSSRPLSKEERKRLGLP